ncbi:hypothetical protein SGRA_0557 [Saprospira grandis str. Lewin]|uniref:Uncharacterized protein n=1 Tax=Saprospira grandis (strain Lewin) TaxID=984262 RepID=H6KZ12_SAPGL|nr:hypothetical protein SGRA_0557 [Saprospira grandis str. Lewin]
MCSSAAQPQTQQKTCFFAQGRANSELRNVAPTTEGRRRPQNNIKLRNDNKAFRPQFDD